jgi:tRNA modification GTPase
MLDNDTIAAIATAPGKGGIGVVRISGPDARVIGEVICSKSLPVRKAVFSVFHRENVPIDEGMALLFCAPASFTGEDVVELQGHGGPVVMQQLLQAVIRQGARQARPGEFSERAFLNGKLDLAQAEAIADLIEAGSAQAARNALHSLQGTFSASVNALAEAMLHLRIYVEAAIDFPEEEIDFLADGKVSGQLANMCAMLETVQAKTRQGALMREGLRVVIAGKPNAGKSSLLNALAGRDAAIVTDIPGTTRDVLREQVVLDGLPLHIIDTAGLRSSTDPVEQEGIRRAQSEMAQADLVLLLVDSSQDLCTDLDALWQGCSLATRPDAPALLVQNKIDQSGLPAGEHKGVIRLSAKTGEGIESLIAALQHRAGFIPSGEDAWSARARHVESLRCAATCLSQGVAQFEATGAGELLAEDLREAHRCLGEITGQVSNDDLLGQIFSSFCIGK